MSSEDEAQNHHNVIPHKKKRGRACDACRQKKVRCDGAPGRRCTNCTAVMSECTYVGSAKKRYPDIAYMESLETQLGNMKKLFNKLHPGIDLSSELLEDSNNLWRVEPTTVDTMQGPSTPWTRQPPLSVAPPALSLSPSPPFAGPSDTGKDDAEQSSDDELFQAMLDARSRKNLIRTHTGGRPRFMGKSSRFMFVHKALDYRHHAAGNTTSDGMLDWHPRPRPEFWITQPWLLVSSAPDPPHPPEAFPPHDLMMELVDHYFRRYNIYLPLLHRPTFERNIKDGLHLRDEAFGSTLLLVCAMGSRFSTDERVLLEEEIITNATLDEWRWQSAGWKWFRRVQTTRKAVALTMPRLFDLQVAGLAAIYLHGTSVSQPAWPLTGIGLRLAQDLGAHRKRMYRSPINAEDEQLKRAFWVLLAVDRSLSSGLGRPCCIQDEDFDVDYPIEVDDEYWDNPDPSLAFKQPPGKPSTISFFCCLLRLKEIHAFALRTLYSIKRSKVAKGYVGPQWEQEIVSQLDSALNQFIDSVPDHLRWDPHRENMTHLTQSAFLYSGYYSLQINVHRPFIPSPRKPSLLSFPSLAICTNAARSCIHVLDVQFNRSGGRGIYQNQSSLFTAGIVLLLNIWGGKLSGASPNPAKEMAEVHKAMKMLKAQEPRWFSAGRYWDILYGMASAGDLPLPETPVSHKRTRDDSSSAAEVPNPNMNMASAEDGQRPLAGSRRAQAYQQQHPMAPPTYDTTNMNGDFVLPVHTVDLGRLPLHSAFDSFNQYADAWFSSLQPIEPTQVPPAPTMTMEDTILDSAFTEPYDPAVVPPNTLMQPGLAGQPQYPSMHDMTAAPAPPPPPDGSIENMMANVSMDANSSSFADYPDNDTLAMWSTAPAGFEWDDWGTFISAIGGGVEFNDSPTGM